MQDTDRSLQHSLGRLGWTEANPPPRSCQTRRSFLLGVVAGAGALVVATCGVEVGGSASTGNESWRQRPVAVSVWTTWWAGGAMNERGQAWQTAQSQFSHLAATERGQVTIDLQPQPAGSASLVDKVTASFAGGTPPDILHTATGQAALFGTQGMAVDLQETFIRQDRTYSRTLEDFFPYILESTLWQGKRYGLPFVANADLPYTNLALLRAAGLQALKAGYTWEQLADFARSLQRSLGPGKWALNGLIGNIQFFNLLKQAGGEVYNKDFTKTTVNSPEGIEALQYASDLVHRYQVHVPFTPTGQTAPQFNKGEVAMHYETSATRVVQWAEMIGGLANMSITPPPRKKKPFTLTDGSDLNIFKTNPDRQEAAWRVARWATSTDALADVTATVMFLPVRKSVLKTAAYGKVVKDVPIFQAFVDAMNDAYRPFHPLWSDHRAVVYAAQTRVWQQPLSVKDELEKAATDINRSLADYNARQTPKK